MAWDLLNTLTLQERLEAGAAEEAKENRKFLKGEARRGWGVSPRL